MSYRRVQKESDELLHMVTLDHSLWSAISCQRERLNSVHGTNERHLDEVLK